MKSNGYCDNALTHESSCRLAESIIDAERLRVGRGQQLHLLGRRFISAPLIMLTPLRHSDTNQNNESSRTINKMLASSDVYIVAHVLRDKGTKRFIKTVLAAITFFKQSLSLISLLARFVAIRVTPRIASCGCSPRYVVHSLRFSTRIYAIMCDESYNRRRSNRD